MEGERALSERWIDERGALLESGPVRRQVARARERSVGDTSLAIGLVSVPILVAGLVADAIEGPAARPRWADVALYPRTATAGTYPIVIAPFAGIGLVERLIAQGGEVGVRGELAPGRGLVLVLDDGTVVPCVGPASPVPALAGRRRYKLRD